MEGEQDHKCLVESKLSSCDHPYKYQLGDTLEVQADALLKHYTAIEEEMRRTVKISPTMINVHEFDNTLDELHSVILDKIAAAMAMPDAPTVTS